MRCRLHRACSLLFAAASLATQVSAQQLPQYDRRELTIPVRDGTALFAVALVPRTMPGPLPIILIRTPFGAAREFRSAELPGSLRELGQDGYIFVTEDIRGRFASRGDFVTMRPMRDARDPKSVDESTDAYDTIDWLVRNLPNNNGRVGVMGVSYRGWLAAVAGIGAHPALRAISPQAPMADIWLGDDLFHQGAFRQTQAVAYAAYVETGKGLAIPDYDQYTFYLRHPTLDSLARATGVTDAPSWAGSRAHPAHDAYWDARALQNVLAKPEVPTLFVGGWWDPEDLFGPQLAYRTLEQADTKGLNHIVLGPWNHGGWARPGGDSLGSIRFGNATADYFREKIQRPWFAWWLHGTGDGKFPEAWAFETGTGAWRTLDSWPPRNARTRNIYLREKGQLSFDAPTRHAAAGAAASDAWISDPAHPVPYVRRPDDGEGWDTWLVQDQRFVDDRPDVVTWKSEPLAEDLTIAGDVVAHLFASTSGTDADWVVKLIDVYPENVPDRPTMGGYELMVNADIMRGRYWKSIALATPIPANTVTPFTVELHQQLYTFRKGHRLMVQVQSTWFPLYDRNPQTFVPNIFQAKPADFTRREHRVWHTARYPSRVAVSVIPGSP